MFAFPQPLRLMNIVSSRRRFLQQAALGGSLLASSAWNPLRAQTESSRRLGIALVGLGSYSTGQLGPALRQTRHCHLAGVVTGSPEKGRKWAADYGFPESSIYGYESMARLAENKDIDIVYVVTPNALHAEHAIAAVRAGKHVIIEKPMANTVADCDAILAACKAAGVRHAVGYRLHHEPHHLELKRFAREKTFGVFMKMSGQHSFRLGLRNGVKPWRAIHALSGGGPLMDVGIYVVQAACLAKLEQWPVAVTAREEPKVRPEFFVDVEETLHFTLEFADGAVLEAVTSYERGGNSFRAEGDKGWVELQPAYGYRGITGNSSAGPVTFPAIVHQAAQMDDFAQCVASGRPSPVPGEMGRRDMVIIEAIYQAMRSGGRVEIARS